MVRRAMLYSSPVSNLLLFSNFDCDWMIAIFE
jgi:hypothetical protein